MRNEDVLDLVRRCKIQEGEELVRDEAYLVNKRFRYNSSGRTYYENEEIIILVNNGIKVGGIYRMGDVDIHIVMDEKYRGQHIMSDFLKKGIIEKIWPENKSVELCGVYTRAEYEKKRYLAELCHMSIKNEQEIEDRLSYFDECRKKYQ